MTKYADGINLRKYDKQLHIYIKPHQLKIIDEYLSELNYWKKKKDRLSRSDFIVNVLLEYVENKRIEEQKEIALQESATQKEKEEKELMEKATKIANEILERKKGRKP